MLLNIKSVTSPAYILGLICGCGLWLFTQVVVASQNVADKNYVTALNVLINNIENMASTIQAESIVMAMAKMLQEDSSIDPNTQGKHGYTLLMFASMLGQLEVMAILLADYRTDPNIQDNSDTTALIYASVENQVAAVEALLADKRTNPNIRDCYGHAALTLATEETVKILLADKRTNPNIQDYADWTVLMNASFNGDIGIVKALLAHHKSKIDLKNDEGLTAYQIALYAGHIKIAKLFRKKL